jgi:hypothetical protein
MTKHDEVSMPGSTLNKARMDEPIFILRAQDTFAASLVRLWITMAQAQGVPQGKLDEARLCAQAMEIWPSTKVPD